MELLILQHPMETGHAKNSARLLHLSVPGSRLLTGEVFDPAGLDLPGADDLKNVLLYPGTPDEETTRLAVPPPLDPAWLRTPGRLRLVVIDATWRKSRKMLYLNPWLQQMPRLSLQDVPASRYLIRKAHKAGQLSTLEAACAALAQLEGNKEKYLPLLAAFDGFVTRQLARRPAAHTS